MLKYIFLASLCLPLLAQYFPRPQTQYTKNQRQPFTELQVIGDITAHLIPNSRYQIKMNGGCCEMRQLGKLLKINFVQKQGCEHATININLQYSLSLVKAEDGAQIDGTPFWLPNKDSTLIADEYSFVQVTNLRARSLKVQASLRSGIYLVSGNVGNTTGSVKDQSRVNIGRNYSSGDFYISTDYNGSTIQRE